MVLYYHFINKKFFTTFENQNVKKFYLTKTVFVIFQVKYCSFISFLEIRCIVPQRRGGANVFPNRRTVGFNETITYSCPSGYNMVGRPSNQFTATCTSSGIFSPDDLLQCRGKNVDS